MIVVYPHINMAAEANCQVYIEKRETMQENNVEHCLIKIAGEDQVKLQEPMKLHTTFRIGGNARYFVTPDSISMLQKLIRFCQENQVPYCIIGNGSNLLVSDRGYDGVVIQLLKNFNGIEVSGNSVHVQAGALLSRTAAAALEEGLAGFEFAAGIPGTIGGAVVMNAGAYGGEMKQVVRQVTALNQQGQIIILKKDELEFGYRTSVLQKENAIVLEVELMLHPGRKEEIRARMEQLKKQRITKQPLEFPSAGSTFKRPEGNYAGQLIMEAGFRGYQVGGARVSDKHCGFVINAGEASAADVIELTEQIQKKVLADTGILLELEVKKLGDFS